MGISYSSLQAGDGERISVENSAKQRKIIDNAFAALSYKERRDLIAQPPTDATLVAAVNLGGLVGNYYLLDRPLSREPEGITGTAQQLCVRLREEHGVDPEVLGVVIQTAADVVVPEQEVRA